MDIARILTELRQEREQIEEAILTLERLTAGRGKRRGRPPAWLSALRKQEREAEKDRTSNGNADSPRAGAR